MLPPAHAGGNSAELEAPAAELGAVLDALRRMGFVNSNDAGRSSTVWRDA